MFCVFLNPDSDKTSLAETLEASVAGLQDKEQAARTKTYQSANQVFGCARANKSTVKTHRRLSKLRCETNFTT